MFDHNSPPYLKSVGDTVNSPPVSKSLLERVSTYDENFHRIKKLALVTPTKYLYKLSLLIRFGKIFFSLA